MSDLIVGGILVGVIFLAAFVAAGYLISLVVKARRKKQQQGAEFPEV